MISSPRKQATMFRRVVGNRKGGCDNGLENSSNNNSNCYKSNGKNLFSMKGKAISAGAVAVDVRYNKDDVRNKEDEDIHAKAIINSKCVGDIDTKSTNIALPPTQLKCPYNKDDNDKNNVKVIACNDKDSLMKNNKNAIKNTNRNGVGVSAAVPAQQQRPPIPSSNNDTTTLTDRPTPATTAAPRTQQFARQPSFIQISLYENDATNDDDIVSECKHNSNDNNTTEYVVDECSGGVVTTTTTTTNNRNNSPDHNTTSCTSSPTKKTQINRTITRHKSVRDLIDSDASKLSTLLNRHRNQVETYTHQTNNVIHVNSMHSTSHKNRINSNHTIHARTNNNENYDHNYISSSSRHSNNNYQIVSDCKDDRISSNYEQHRLEQLMILQQHQQQRQQQSRILQQQQQRQQQYSSLQHQQHQHHQMQIQRANSSNSNMYGSHYIGRQQQHQYQYPQPSPTRSPMSLKHQSQYQPPPPQSPMSLRHHQQYQPPPSRSPMPFQQQQQYQQQRSPLSLQQQEPKPRSPLSLQQQQYQSFSSPTPNDKSNHDRNDWRSLHSPTPTTSSNRNHPQNIVSNNNATVNTLPPSTMTAAAAPAAATTVAVEVADDVEITPGLHLRLRGSAETYQAIKYNFYTSHICCVCSTTIYCIFDADYIICPFCKVVDALHKQPNATTNNNSNLKQQCSNQNKFEEDPDDSTTCAENAGGVGLGFSENDLHKWQLEIRSKAGGGIGGGD